MDARNIFIFFVCGLTLASGVLFANDILPQNTASSGKNLFIKTNIPRESDRPSVYNLKRWVIEENTDPVKRALEVYKKKSQPGHVKRIWITDRKDGKRHMIAEYTPRGTDDKIVFSQDEDFMYYLGMTPGGANIVYGVNLLSEKKFTFGAGEDFSTLNCPDRKSYVIVQQGQDRKVYHVYTSTGERMPTLTNIQNPVDLQKSLCR